MLTIYAPRDGGLKAQEAAGEVAGEAVWIDMLHPSADDERIVETALGIDVPTHEEMQEIEISSRLYREDGTLFMTAALLTNVDDDPKVQPVTFILAGSRLVTLRYSEPRSFALFAQRAERRGSGYETSAGVLAGLLDTLVDRLADILEHVGADIDALSREIFERQGGGRAGGQPTPRDYHVVLRRVGRKGDLNSKARESLVSIGRLAAFLVQSLDEAAVGRAVRGRIDTVARDVQSLSDHASFLSNKINFLLDAVLGMISIEQNAIIKIFSVAAVAFLPPTLIASIYGMNFAFMPELAWPWGYLLALLMMVASAALPLWYFRRRGWL